MLIKQIIDWFGNVDSSKRFSIDWNDAASVARTIAQVMITAGLAELYRLIGPTIVDDSVTRVVTYVVIGALLQLAKKYIAAA